jgi:hypothetical protein
MRTARFAPNFGSIWRVCARLAPGAVAAVALAGCGGANPTLHPAHVLPAKRVATSAGFSHHFTPGDAQSSLDGAREALEAEPAATEDPDLTLARGALVAALSAPKLSPWLGARAGLGHAFEAGLGYTGKRVQVDLRRGFQDSKFAFSVGGALIGIPPEPGAQPSGEGSAVPTSVDADDTLPGANVGDLRGFGFSVPVLAGYRAVPRMLDLWLGAHATYERASGSVGFRFADSSGFSSHLSASRYDAGVVLGFALGVAPVWLAAELGAGYEWYDADFARVGAGATGDPVRATLGGAWLSPAAALCVEFR